MKVSEELLPMANWLIENNFITRRILGGNCQADNDTFVFSALLDSTSTALDVVAMRIALHRIDLPIQEFLEMNEDLVTREQLDHLATRKAIKIENEILIAMSPLIREYFLRLLSVFPYEDDSDYDYKFFNKNREHNRLYLEYYLHGYVEEAEWHDCQSKLPF